MSDVSSGNTVVKYSPRHPKVMGSNPPSTNTKKVNGEIDILQCQWWLNPTTNDTEKVNA
jgi:hypothetical protein